MIAVELKLKYGTKCTFFLQGNVAVWEENEGKAAGLQDGNHNNGGWRLDERYDVVVEKIKKAMRESKNGNKC